MLAVVVPPGVRRQEIEAEAKDLVLAVDNSPSSIVFSGPREAILGAEERLKQRGIWAEKVKVDYASHSPAMEPLLPELFTRLAGLRPHQAKVPYGSATRGTFIDGRECDPSYWTKNLRQPVRFRQTIAALLEKQPGPVVFVELSCHPVLLKPIEQTAAASAVH
jgi:acyl transferase domain-containing protein